LSVGALEPSLVYNQPGLPSLSTVAEGILSACIAIELVLPNCDCAKPRLLIIILSTIIIKLKLFIDNDETIMFRDYRRVEGYEDYIISNYGEVYSTKYYGNTEWREMKQQTDKDGYKVISIYKDGKQKTISIHVLVGIHYIGKREGELTYDHYPKTDKNNNRADNLRLATKLEQQENTGVCKNNKLGEKHICSVIDKRHGSEYFRIVIVRNGKYVFDKWLNKKKFSLDDAIKVRDDFLESQKS